MYQHNKRLSLDSSVMFRAESMPGLCLPAPPPTSSSAQLHGSMLSLSSTTISAGSSSTSNTSGSSSNSSNRAQRHNSAPRLASTVQRSHSTHSTKRGFRDAIYVNSEVIREHIAEEMLASSQEQQQVDELPSSPRLSTLPRPKSASAILRADHKRMHVCEITIAGGHKDDPVSKPGGVLSTINHEEPLKQETSSLPRRSNSTASSSKSCRKASKILGLNPSDVAAEQQKHLRKVKKTDPDILDVIDAGAELQEGPKEQRPLRTLEDKTKSLGDLHIESGLPTAPSVSYDKDWQDSKEVLVVKAQKFVQFVKTILAREKTLTITPKKSSSKSLNRLSMGQKPPNLQLLSHTSFPGLPTYPVLAAGRSSPWNC